MADTFGWVGKMALIDLTSKSCELLATTDYKKFIGGKGINQYLLLKNVSPGVDAHSPENMLLIGAGPLVGTLAPAGCRTSIDTINALTGGTASANCGGFFASELKYAGFDHLLIVGKASKPVYLFIHDGMVEFRDAKPLRGLSTWETESYIRNELNDVKVRVLSIGPAGENLLSTACIITENGRAAAKGGTGSVMGSKNLKAIAAKIADSSGCRIELEEESIPVDPEVKGFADILGLDPLYMGNEGKMIAVVPADQAEKALEVMKATEHGKNAAVIGSASEGGGTFLKTHLGATRRVDALYGEGLPRIC